MMARKVLHLINVAIVQTYSQFVFFFFLKCRSFSAEETFVLISHWNCGGMLEEGVWRKAIIHGLNLL